MIPSSPASPNNVPPFARCLCAIMCTLLINPRRQRVRLAVGCLRLIRPPLRDVPGRWQPLSTSGKTWTPLTLSGHHSPAQKNGETLDTLDILALDLHKVLY